MPRSNGAKAGGGKPTDGELEILQVLWRLNVPVTTRDVHDHISKQRDVAHVTIATMMQLMEKKGLLEVIDPRRPRKYRATGDVQKTYDVMLKDLVKKVFAGSKKKLVMHLFADKQSAAEMAKVEKLLDELERD